MNDLVNHDYLSDNQHSSSEQDERQTDRLSLSPDQSFELLESISEAFYGLDSDWRFIYLNRKAEQLWNRKREELIGKNIWEEFPQGVNTQAYIEMHRALDEQQTVRFETFSLFLDAWVEVEVYPTRTGLSLYFHDITRRRQAENVIENSRKHLQLITDSLPVLISHVDQQMRYQFVNKQYQEWFGLSSDQIIGKHVSEVTGQTAFEGAKKDIEAALDGKPVRYEREIPYTTGTRFTSTQMLPFRLDDGTKDGFITIVEDITQRRQAEAGLARLAAIVTSSNDAIISETLDGIITSWNQGAERMFGYSTEEVIQKPIKILIPPEKIGEEAILLQKITNDELVQNYDTVRLKKDGSRVFVWVSLSPLKDELGHIEGISKIVQDTSERKRAEEALHHYAERLEASNKELEAFSYSVSHDLRAPLRAIDGFSRILLRDYAPQLPEPAQRYLNLVRDNSQQMGKLIDDLLTFSRLNRQPLTRQPVDMVRMIHQVLEELSSEQENRQVEMIIGDLPVCQADPALLKQVLTNLLSNALKFTRQRDVARIEVDYEEVDGKKAYYIKDNGAGFDIAYADKLFGVFQRLHRADEFPGAGVGLAIVQRIIHRHGGRVWANAEVDKGATFYFILEGGVPND